MSPSSHKADEATQSKMTKTNPPEKNTHAGEAQTEKVAGKRQRRPSVRLGDIGGYQSSDSNRKVTNKSQSNGKQIRVNKNKDLKNVGVSNSEVYETLGREKEGKLDRIETGRSNKSLVANTKRIRSSLMNVDDKFGKNWGDEFRVSDSESPGDSAGNLEIEKQGKSDKIEIVSTKRIRSDRVSVDKFSGGKDEDDGGFRVSDSESPEREDSPIRSIENLEIENGDQVGNCRSGVRKELRILECGDQPSENGDGVKGWLDQLGLGRYGPVFDVHEVDDEVLPLLTLEDLKDMGINAVGSRRKMFAYIQKLRKGIS